MDTRLMDYSYLASEDVLNYLLHTLISAKQYKRSAVCRRGRGRSPSVDWGQRAPEGKSEVVRGQALGQRAMPNARAPCQPAGRPWARNAKRATSRHITGSTTSVPILSSRLASSARASVSRS